MTYHIHLVSLLFLTEREGILTILSKMFLPIIPLVAQLIDYMSLECSMRRVVTIGDYMSLECSTWRMVTLAPIHLFVINYITFYQSRVFSASRTSNRFYSAPRSRSTITSPLRCVYKSPSQSCSKLSKDDPWVYCFNTFEVPRFPVFLDFVM